MGALCWVDGRVRPAHEASLPADDSAFREGRGCYSSARWTGRGLRFEARHLARLARDAAALGIGAVDAEEARRAAHELGRAAFGAGEGVVRIQASRRGEGGVRIVALARPLGAERDRWRAVTLPLRHEGAMPWAGAKVSNRLLHVLGADRVAEAGVDEGLLLDAEGRLVEGTRANLVAVAEDGVPCTPPEARGAVDGVALSLARASVPVEARDVPRAALGRLRELVALNAVRGAVAIVELDGRPVGDGRPGPVAARLAAALDAHP